MSKTQPATVAGQQIKSYVDRIERMEDERKAIGGDIKDIYREAKGNGYDVKTLRWLVQERRIHSADRDERDALRDTYMHALNSAVHLVQVEGLSLREAAKRTGTSKSSIHRALAVPAVSQGTGDADRVTTETEEVDNPGGAAGHPSPLSDPAEQSVKSDPPPGRVSPLIIDGQGTQPGTPFMGDDPGPPPVFLRRTA